MLKLSRREGEEIIIKNKETEQEMVFKIDKIDGGTVRISFDDTSRNFTILRSELEE